jgi:hypothetical protein
MGGCRNWDAMMVDCPKCGAKQGVRCHYLGGPFHKERWLIAPVRRTKAIENFAKMGSNRNAKLTKVANKHQLDVTNWVSAPCKANRHHLCTSLNCSCACGHR